MLIVLIAKKRFGFGFWIQFNYSRIVNYSELPIPTYSTFKFNSVYSKIIKNVLVYEIYA